jgi:hypothetical protein
MCTGIPAVRRWVALLCRTSWSRPGRTPEAFRSAPNRWVSRCGWIRPPASLTNTRSLSTYALAAASRSTSWRSRCASSAATSRKRPDSSSRIWSTRPLCSGLSMGPPSGARRAGDPASSAPPGTPPADSTTVLPSRPPAKAKRCLFAATFMTSKASTSSLTTEMFHAFRPCGRDVFLRRMLGAIGGIAQGDRTSAPTPPPTPPRLSGRSPRPRTNSQLWRDD